MGENCIIISQVGISGSVNIGKGSYLLGQAGITGHLTIGEESIIFSQSALGKSIPPRSHVSGSPARSHVEAKRVFASTQKLPRYIKIIQDLQKRVQKLETKDD